MVPLVCVYAIPARAISSFLLASNKLTAGVIVVGKYKSLMRFKFKAPVVAHALGTTSLELKKA